MPKNIMKRRWAIKYTAISAAFFVVTFLWIFPVAAFDFSDWDALIKKHVSLKKVDGISINAVNYMGLKNDMGFEKLVSRLNSAQPDSLTRDGKLVFWINTYNILAAKMVADRFPIKSIKDAGSFFSPVWKKPAGHVAGKQRTLNEIEHEILRKMDEPRIHVAIVCASVSCPDLRLEAFNVERLNEQLDDQMKMFIESTEKGMKIDKVKNRVYLSSIFKWFEDDFESRGGVLKFISNYVSPEAAKELQSSKIKVSYLKYNWGVNG
ncbi:MAG: DUF547 domain-containing protein [Nitrospina sp.]|jgi:hypothetical protein|nr:DUF547 domain-containing protein [Nitrospina sp.]MBT6716932.1 DUF547 domain-containing protein [Nitrospina sp.]